jgi:hypothetical protein
MTVGLETYRLGLSRSRSSSGRVSFLLQRRGGDKMVGVICAGAGAGKVIKAY